MFRRPVKEITAEFLAEEKYLDSIQRTVRDTCISAGFSRKDTNAVLLAMEEGATNVIRHAYLYEKGSIRLRIVIFKKQVVFSLIDTGRSFQPDGSGTLDLKRLVDSGRKGGLGFYMINKIMDSVEYISSAGYNELRMIKRIHQSSTGSVPFLRRMFSLRVKFSVWTIFIVSIIVGGSYYYIDRQTTQQLRSNLDETVSSLANTIAAQASLYIINRRSDAEFDELIVSYIQSNSDFLRLIVLTDSNNIIMAHSDDIHNIRKRYRLPSPINPNMLEIPQMMDEKEKVLKFLIIPIKTGEIVLGRVNMLYSSEQLQGRLDEARQNTVLLTLVLLMFGILGVYLLSSYFVDPIVKITRRVRKFASGDLKSELPLEGAEEFFEISRAFNELMTRVSQDRENIIAREKMAKEIEVASHIQKTLLPRELPDLPGLELEAFYRAAEVIGGDLYDVFRIDPERFCLVVADVSGKGVPASLVMSMLRTVIQIHSAGKTSSKETLIKVNDYLQYNIPPGMFITVMLAIYYEPSKELNFVSAGHNPMLFYKHATKQIVKMNPNGMPMGMPATLETTFENRLEEVTLKLEEGDTFFMFTDGITEASNRDGEQFGMDRLINTLEKQLSNGTAADTSILRKELIAEIDDFSGFIKPSDDITFVLARLMTVGKDLTTETKTIEE